MASRTTGFLDGSAGPTETYRGPKAAGGHHARHEVTEVALPPWQCSIRTKGFPPRKC
jgi:hypothetical protein